jgi:hypothetical protein
VDTKLNDTQSSEEDRAQVRIAYLASLIHDEKQLRQVVNSAQLGLQRGVYNQLLPHLSFKPRNFRKLMRNA